MRTCARAAVSVQEPVLRVALNFPKAKINAKGYHPAEVVKPEECIGCASCARTCPDVVIRIEKD